MTEEEQKCPECPDCGDRLTTHFQYPDGSGIEFDACETCGYGFKYFSKASDKPKQSSEKLSRIEKYRCMNVKRKMDIYKIEEKILESQKKQPRIWADTKVKGAFDSDILITDSNGVNHIVVSWEKAHEMFKEWIDEDIAEWESNYGCKWDDLGNNEHYYIDKWKRRLVVE